MYSLCVERWPDWLTALMKRLNVNNKGMAALVGVSPTTIGNWLAGGPPEAASILRLGQLAKVPPTEVFTIAFGGELVPYTTLKRGWAPFIEAVQSGEYF